MGLAHSYDDGNYAATHPSWLDNFCRWVNCLSNSWGVFLLHSRVLPFLPRRISRKANSNRIQNKHNVPGELNSMKMWKLYHPCILFSQFSQSSELRSEFGAVFLFHSRCLLFDASMNQQKDQNKRTPAKQKAVALCLANFHSRVNCAPNLGLSFCSLSGLVLGRTGIYR